jgi:hypothetical protein
MTLLTIMEPNTSIRVYDPCCEVETTMIYDPPKMQSHFFTMLFEEDLVTGPDVSVRVFHAQDAWDIVVLGVPCQL